MTPQMVYYPQTSEEKRAGQQTAHIWSQRAEDKLGSSGDEAGDSDGDRWWWWCVWAWTAATTFNKATSLNGLLAP